ncbi:MAG: 30S ribosomal protein S3 [Hadesarchaea archaeon]|nr:30S ribosomal protein S3 [Hadesarchaea archaeon]
MSIERIFVKRGYKMAELEEFLEKELERAGYGGVEIRPLPTGTRVVLYVERPGMVIGRKGRSIKQLTDELAQKYGMENPQIEVVEIKVPELCAPIMAKRIAFALERGINFRRIGQTALRRIMRAGAKGAEIVLSGKLSGERARSERFYEGYLKKAGEPATKFVSYGYAVAKLKPGVVGVKVRIMPPDVHLPDEIRLTKEVGTESIQVRASAEAEASSKPEEQSTEVGGDGDSQIE